MIKIYIFMALPSSKAKLIDNKNPLLLVKIVTLTAM